MNGEEQHLEHDTVKASWFTTTHWSVVLAAGSGETAGAALEKLCRTYWYPLYAYVRRKGHQPDDARDLTQAFFERMLEKNYVLQADRQKGKFRSFLLAALNHFLTDEWKKARAQKRGGGQQLFSLNQDEAESSFRLEPATSETPERIFERRWALTLLDQALARLREEFVAAGKAGHFEQLKRFLSNEANEDAYQSTARALGNTPGAVAVMVHRLRQRYRELVRKEIAHTVSQPAEIDDEMSHLFAILSQ